MKIHKILIRHFFLSFSDPSWPSRFLGSDIFGFFRNLLSKFTTVKSKLKFCLKHLSLGSDIGNLEVPKQPKSAKFWTGIIQILILATQLGFEKNRNFLAIFRHFGHCAQWGESRFIAKLLQILSIESHDLTSFWNSLLNCLTTHFDLMIFLNIK